MMAAVLDGDPDAAEHHMRSQALHERIMDWRHAAMSRIEDRQPPDPSDSLHVVTVGTGLGGFRQCFAGSGIESIGPHSRTGRKRLTRQTCALSCVVGVLRMQLSSAKHCGHPGAPILFGLKGFEPAST